MREPSSLGAAALCVLRLGHVQADAIGPLEPSAQFPQRGGTRSVVGSEGVALPLHFLLQYRKSMGRAREKQKIHDLTVTTLRVEREKLDRFGEIAVSQHRTISQQLRHLIEQAIAEADREPEDVTA